MRGQEHRARRAGIVLNVALAVTLLAGLPIAGADTQETARSPGISDPRLDRLEKEVAELRAELKAELARRAAEGQAAEKDRLAEIERRIDVLAAEIERLRVGEEVAGATTPEQGMGPAASKIYRTQRGVSLGGYGEALYEGFKRRADDGSPASESDRLDLLRGVVYVGYKWTDRWLLNSELEWEHANTEKGGEAAVEFAYLDYRWRPELSFRGGLMLMPVGILNELHEPTTFLSARRPEVETFLIPTTWRESGVGIYGQAGAFSYRAYLTGGLDASGFSAAEGIREGSAEGSEAKAEDLAGVARLDWTPRPGLLAGFSVFHGGSGQGLTSAAGRRLRVGTTLAESHLEWRYRGLELRALAVRLTLSDVAELDRARELAGTETLGDRMDGGYVELGYDVFSAFPHGEQALTPFVRYERVNTQASVPAGFAADPANDTRIWTMGLAYRPIPQVIFKADYQNFDNRAGSGLDRFHLALGYIF